MNTKTFKHLKAVAQAAELAHMLARTIEMQVNILIEDRDTPTLRKARIEAVAKHAEETMFLMDEIGDLIKDAKQGDEK